MKRLKLLLGMAALACAIGLTVKYGSAYRPVVGPVREIEEIWAIEDEREESEEPLVTRLFLQRRGRRPTTRKATRFIARWGLKTARNGRKSS